jgi:hypothetical protein
VDELATMAATLANGGACPGTAIAIDSILGVHEIECECESANGAQ